MPTIKLTQPAIEKLKALPSGRIEYWDNQLPGFGLRISETGRKTWVVMYRVGGKLVRETLGTAAVIPNLAHARSREPSKGASWSEPGRTEKGYLNEQLS
jgi:hypothetical protein